MNQRPEENTDKDLAPFFEAAKTVETPPCSEFLNRVMQDAHKETENRLKNNMLQRSHPAVRTWLVEIFGEWRPLGALATCCCLGVFAGYTVPESVAYVTGVALETEIINMSEFSSATDIEALFEEV